MNEKVPADDDMELIKMKRANENKPGFNEYGTPLHACHGYRHDEHYWAMVHHENKMRGVT